ncbi:YciI-like protein [Actinocorallia aurea]
MLILVYCLDKPGSQALRVATRPEHLRYMIAARDRLPFGGPLHDDAGVVIGSVFALEVENPADAEEFLADEPYYRAGLFGSVVTHPMVAMVPEAWPGRLAEELVKAERAARV